MKTLLPTVALVTLLSLGTAGCSSLSNTQRGALIGAGAGGALGAIVGDAAGSTAKGAIIGAVVGGAAGAIIGSRMNDRAETLERELDNATIERVGEGILVTFDSGILFGFDSSRLQATARNNLSDLARVLATDSDEGQAHAGGGEDDRGAQRPGHLDEERRRARGDDLGLVGPGRRYRAAQEEPQDPEPAARRSQVHGRQPQNDP